MTRPIQTTAGTPELVVAVGDAATGPAVCALLAAEPGVVDEMAPEPAPDPAVEESSGVAVWPMDTGASAAFCWSVSVATCRSDAVRC